MRGSRNKGLLSAAFFCLRGDLLCVTKPGLERPFVLETTGLTPKACTARQDETMMEENSFMVSYGYEQKVNWGVVEAVSSQSAGQPRCGAAVRKDSGDSGKT